MPESPKKAIILKTTVRINPSFKNAFADWQSKLNEVIASFPGFVSLEISKGSTQDEWVITQRFNSTEDGLAWRASKERGELIAELKRFLIDEDALQETEVEINSLQRGVTEVFITEVSPGKDRAFQEWIAKMHQVEAKFTGFLGVYIQAPSLGQGKNWITLLQFDTQENLDRWLASSERQQVLNESKSLIAAIESHRVISPYAGWFSSIAENGVLPPVWKQTMIVLLVLFPIVMLELKFLSPLTQNLGNTLTTFIGNAISVTLIAWPMMPIAIRFLGWWLSPDSSNYTKTIIGTFVMIVLYLFEIVIFRQFNN